MVRGEASWRWLALVLALGTSGCFIIGGQTGDSASAGDDDDDDNADSGSCNPSRALAFNQVSSMGYSAETMLTGLGGTRRANLTTAAAEFWQTLGIDPAPALPLPMVLSITHTDGSTIENQCSRYLSIQVMVSLDVGDRLLQRTGIATLQGTLASSDLMVVLDPPAAGDASALPVTLDVRLTSAGVQGELLAGASTVSAGFSGP